MNNHKKIDPWGNMFEEEKSRMPTININRISKMIAVGLVLVAVIYFILTHLSFADPKLMYNWYVSTNFDKIYWTYEYEVSRFLIHSIKNDTIRDAIMMHSVTVASAIQDFWWTPALCLLLLKRARRLRVVLGIPLLIAMVVKLGLSVQDLHFDDTHTWAWLIASIVFFILVWYQFIYLRHSVFEFAPWENICLNFLKACAICAALYFAFFVVIIAAAFRCLPLTASVTGRSLLISRALWPK
jgi:hypothetical protein